VKVVACMGLTLVNFVKRILALKVSICYFDPITASSSEVKE
jgi:hypothetical protein